MAQVTENHCLLCRP